MPRLFGIKVRVCFVITIFASTLMSVTACQSQDLIRTVVLAEAHQRDETDGFGFGAPFLNNNGSVLFTRSFTTVEFVEQGNFNLETGEITTFIAPVSTPRDLTLILARADNAPLEVTQSEGAFVFTFSQVALSAADEAIFLTQGSNGGVFRTTSDGTEQLLIDSTSTATNAEPGTQFMFPLREISTSNDGKVAYLLDVRGPGIRLNFNSHSIYRETESGNPELVAHHGFSRIPESDDLLTGVVSTPGLSDAGEVVFTAGLAGEDTGFGSGLLSKTEGGPLEVVYRGGDSVLVDGELATFRSSSGTASVNDVGKILFEAGYTLPDGVIRSSLLVTTDAGLETVATTADLAFGTTGGIRYRSVNGLGINNDGDVAFSASLNTSEEPFVSLGTAIYLYGNDQSLRLIARTRNEEAVGTDGEVFTVIYSPRLNENGQLAFFASLSGVGSSGIFGLDASGELQLVVATGDTIDVSDTPGSTDLRTIRLLGFARGNSNANNGFNDLGQVAFRATFTDGTTGVFVSDRLVPPPFVLGDCNLDGEVTYLDIPSMIEALMSGTFLEQADCNQDGEVNFLDIAPFIAILSSN